MCSCQSPSLQVLVTVALHVSCHARGGGVGGGLVYLSSCLSQPCHIYVCVCMSSLSGRSVMAYKIYVHQLATVLIFLMSLHLLGALFGLNIQRQNIVGMHETLFRVCLQWPHAKNLLALFSGLPHFRSEGNIRWRSRFNIQWNSVFRGSYAHSLEIVRDCVTIL